MLDVRTKSSGSRKYIGAFFFWIKDENDAPSTVLDSVKRHQEYGSATWGHDGV